MLETGGVRNAKSEKVLESHNNKLHVKKEDTVMVISGKDKGKKAVSSLLILVRTASLWKVLTW